MCEQLDIELWPQSSPRYSRFIRATEPVSMVFEHQHKRQLHQATWWLLLDKTQQPGQGTVFKPSRYTSFNTRYDKLNRRGSAGYVSYRQHRCILPVSGFGETTRQGGKPVYHDMQVEGGQGLALGGLYRTWQGQDGEGLPFSLFSCSVVTLPPHPKLSQIHPKSTPLMLSFEDGSLDTWLDSSITQPELLDPLLEPRIRHRLLAREIDKPSTHNPVAEAFVIEPD